MMIDCLPNFRIYQFKELSPIIDPITETNAHQRAQSNISSPYRKYMTQVTIFENVMRYIPVADETLAGTPMANKSGLKITPPPSPSAPATHPPVNPRNSTFLRTLPLKIKSLSAMLIPPNFSFNAYSFATNLVEMSTWTIMQIKKITSALQSPASHLSNTLPLRIWLASSKQSATRLIPCFFHCP